MTKRRYHKLMLAYMTRIMSHNKGAGRVLKAARDSQPLQQNGGPEHRNWKSYEEVWDVFAPFAAEYGIR